MTSALPAHDLLFTCNADVMRAGRPHPTVGNRDLSGKYLVSAWDIPLPAGTPTPGKVMKSKESPSPHSATIDSLRLPPYRTNAPGDFPPMTAVTPSPGWVRRRGRWRGNRTGAPGSAP